MTRFALLPSIASRPAPGPLSVRSSTLLMSPVFSVIVPQVSEVRSMTSPDTALTNASRSEPVPLSSQLLTAIVSAGRSARPASRGSSLQLTIERAALIAETKPGANCRRRRPAPIIGAAKAETAWTMRGCRRARARGRRPAALCRTRGSPSFRSERSSTDSLGYRIIDCSRVDIRKLDFFVISTRPFMTRAGDERCSDRVRSKSKAFPRARVDREYPTT